ncbi:MAG TPA: bifunctional nuclease family protein [Gemmatimonadales bacterium]|nr:bifunctional nuclease family protein [Gemmatimonadales bacterium]
MIRMRVAHLGLDRATNTPVVVLREDEGERTLPIWIGASEANAIALELQGVRPERPLTHDLMKQLVAGLGGELRRVLIAGLRENTYLAQLLIYRGTEVFEVDARPSDSIALALRMNAPIFSEEDLLDRSARSSESSPTQPGDDPEALKRFLERLDPQDLGRFQP